MARPSSYTDELGDEICDLIIAGASIRQIAAQDTYPAQSTLHRWISDPEHPFSERYARACESRGVTFGDKVAELAFAVASGQIKPDAARVAIDALKWSAARMAPKRFGDKLDVKASVTGAVGVFAVPVGPSSVEEWEKLSDLEAGGAVPEEPVPEPPKERALPAGRSTGGMGAVRA